MGRVSDDPSMNSMASPNCDNALEKGTILTFGSWTYIADGSGGFTKHLEDHESVESNSTDHLPSNNSTAAMTNTENPPEETREDENFDLIKRYWIDTEATSQPRVDNPDLLKEIDHVSEKIAQCIDLAQATLEQGQRSIRH